jgi:hypothetical protein
MMVGLALGVAGLIFAAAVAAQEERLGMGDLAAQAERQERLRSERRATAQARTERDRSRSQFAGQSAAEALGTARARHAAFVLAPAWTPFTLRPGARVANYLGDFAATVEHPDGEQTLVETTHPMRVADESGDFVPVDLALAEKSGWLEPRSPLATLTLSKAAPGVARLPDIGATFMPTSDPGAGDAMEVAGKAFYGNVAVDTDYLARPVAGGVQVAWQLRSAASPERLGLDFMLSAGAVLRRAEHEGDGPRPANDLLEVVRRGERLASVTAPVAWDADGERVPVSYALEGGRVVVEVDHRGGDWLYPLMVDPVVVEDWRHWRTNAGLDFAGWSTSESPVGEIWKHHFGDMYLGRGMDVYSRTARTYNSGEYGAWDWDAPGDAFVYQTEFHYLEHEPDGTLLTTGIYSPTAGGWEASTTQGGPLGYGWSRHCTNWPSCTPTGGDKSNWARFMLWANGTGHRTGTMTAYMGGAAVYMNDQTPPISGVTHNDLPADWTASATPSAGVGGRDGGLGVKSFELHVPGHPIKTRTHPCTGDRNDRCPRTVWTFANDAPVSGDAFSYSTANMPEGYNNVWAAVVDFAGNPSWEGWQVKVDRSPPKVVFNGSLWEQRDRTADPGFYRIEAEGQEGYSGVKDIRMFLDGREIAHATQTPYDSAWLQTTARVDTYTLPPGEHVLVATAVDKLNHTRTESFKFFTAEGTPCLLNPLIDDPSVPVKRPLGSLGLCANWPL